MDRLNGQFENASDYFRKVVQFLSSYQWIYEYPNTHILLHHVPDRIPIEWSNVLNFDHLQDIEQQTISGHCPPAWPPDLKEFLSKCWSFSLRMDSGQHNGVEDDRKWTKVNPKKVHEVLKFSKLIGENCQQNKIQHAVDIGAGLGYLDKELADRYHLHVLGLEQDSYRVTAANRRAQLVQNTQVPLFQATFKELTLSGDQDFEAQVESIISDWFLESNIDSAPLCMIGLHACGDLSPIMLKLFLKCQKFRSMLLVSCCYHRMRWNGGQPDDHFPMSCSLGNSSRSISTTPFHHQTGLAYLFRLAAQETSNRWLLPSDDRNQQQLHHTFYRSILQTYSVNEGIPLKKQQRKAVKSIQNVEEYIKQAVQGFGLEDIDGDHFEKIMDIYHQKKHLLPRLETLIILQVLIQPVAEALMLLDRVAYLQENGVSAKLQQIFDDRISPRCFVTIAEKIT